LAALSLSLGASDAQHHPSLAIRSRHCHRGGHLHALSVTTVKLSLVLCLNLLDELIDSPCFGPFLFGRRPSSGEEIYSETRTDEFSSRAQLLNCVFLVGNHTPSGLLGALQSAVIAAPLRKRVEGTEPRAGVVTAAQL